MMMLLHLKFTNLHQLTKVSVSAKCVQCQPLWFAGSLAVSDPEANDMTGFSAEEKFTIKVINVTVSEV